MRTPPGTCALASSPTFWPRLKIACSPSLGASSGASGSWTRHQRSFGHCRPEMYRDLESLSALLEPIVTTQWLRDARLRASSRRGRLGALSEAVPPVASPATAALAWEESEVLPKHLCRFSGTEHRERPASGAPFNAACQEWLVIAAIQLSGCRCRPCGCTNAHLYHLL